MVILSSQISSISESRANIANYIREKKGSGSFTVIDIGGTSGGWSDQIRDCLIDININNYEKLSFKCNVNYESEWKEVLDYVEKNGKFDFSICSHIMEDISCPQVLKNMLTRISKSGYVSFPSKYAELSHLESKDWVGYFHHRWIYEIKDSVLWGFPKAHHIYGIPRLLELGNQFNNDNQNLELIWENDFDFKIINNDWLGPNKETIIQYYKDWFLD